VPREAPGEDVWRKIIAEVRSETSGTQAAHAGESDVVDLNARRIERAGRAQRFGGQSRWVASIAAAAALVIAVPLVLVATNRSSQPERRAELLAVSSVQVSGNAELQDRTLSIEFAGGAAPADSYYELWLLDIDDEENLRDLRSIGRVEADELVFEIPEGIDLERFDVVDVSIEPNDGDATHSGDSILRGVLDSA